MRRSKCRGSLFALFYRCGQDLHPCCCCCCCCFCCCSFFFFLSPPNSSTRAFPTARPIMAAIFVGEIVWWSRSNGRVLKDNTCLITRYISLGCLRAGTGHSQSKPREQTGPPARTMVRPHRYRYVEYKAHTPGHPDRASVAGHAYSPLQACAAAVLALCS